MLGEGKNVIVATLLCCALLSAGPRNAVRVAVQSPPVPPCGDVWGSAADRRAIEQAMLSGTAQDVATAINQARRRRGNRAGCAEASYSYAKPDFTEPSLRAITENWRQKHAPRLAAYDERCPRAARNWAFSALGGYYARLAGQEVALEALAKISDAIEATQYNESRVSQPPRRTPGMYGYLSAAESDPCFDRTDIAGKPIGLILNQLCQTKPAMCVEYTNGLWANKTFVIADYDPADFLDGGGAYDHGIAGVMMIEAARQQTDKRLKEKYKHSALLAGAWAIAEPPVRNHNYTAKLVWLLALLYNWTGEPRFRAGLIDKLERNLLPGVLMDADRDGKVDGMTDQAFGDLAPAAQRPGRYWDGHNSRPVYHAMNTYALVEAYVALRDRGDRAEAARVKSYALATLDNLASEINQHGVPNSGHTQIPYALLLGLYKIAAYERAPRREWDRALAAFWNAGFGERGGETSASVGLYLLLKSGKRYAPPRGL